MNYLNVLENEKGMFNTRTGKLVDLRQPTEQMICIEDIAYALSKICRFGGHTVGHWSVAAHSILVAHLAPATIKLEALLHDAAEAYIGDVIKPLKNMLGSTYSDIEAKFEAVIASKFYLNHDYMAQIKTYDVEALKIEHEALIKDDMACFYALQTMIHAEAGGKCDMNYLPELFINLFKRYNNQRINQMEAPDNIYFI